jgi:hypothetical protein
MQSDCICVTSKLAGQHNVHLPPEGPATVWRPTQPLHGGIPSQFLGGIFGRPRRHPGQAIWRDTERLHLRDGQMGRAAQGADQPAGRGTSATRSLSRGSEPGRFGRVRVSDGASAVLRAINSSRDPSGAVLLPDCIMPVLDLFPDSALSRALLDPSVWDPTLRQRFRYDLTEKGGGKSHLSVQYGFLPENLLTEAGQVAEKLGASEIGERDLAQALAETQVNALNQLGIRGDRMIELTGSFEREKAQPAGEKLSTDKAPLRRLELQLPARGRAILRTLTYGDALDAAHVAENAPEADRVDAYSNFVFSRLVAEPGLTPSAAASLAPEDVAVLAPSAAKQLGLFDEFQGTDPQLDPRARLYEAFCSDRQRELEQLKSITLSALGPLADAKEVLAGIGWTTMLEDLAALKAAADPAIQLAGLMPTGVLNDALEQGKMVEWLGLPQLKSLANAVSGAGLAPWALDDVLATAGFNSRLVHTPGYVPSVRSQTKPTQRELDERRLTDAFDSLVKLEFDLRELISDKLAAVAGSSWWSQRVPRAVQEGCATRKADKEKPGRPINDPIAYAYPDDYRAILMRKDNWRECFQSVFVNPTDTEACFNWVSIARAEVAHVRPLDDETFTSFIFAARRLCTAIARARRTESK